MLDELEAPTRPAGRRISASTAAGSRTVRSTRLQTASSTDASGKRDRLGTTRQQRQLDLGVRCPPPEPIKHPAARLDRVKTGTTREVAQVCSSAGADLQDRPRLETGERRGLVGAGRVLKHTGERR